MGEDYTYEQPAVIAVRGTDLDALRQRVGELEHQLAQADSNTVALAARNAELAAQLAELEPSGFAMANSALIQRVHQVERENAELRAKLDAVPVDAMRYLHGPMPVVDGKMEKSWKAIKAYLDTLPQAAQP